MILRLRDLTAENDSEHRRRVADLEKELELTADLQGQSCLEIFSISDQRHLTCDMFNCSLLEYS